MGLLGFGGRGGGGGGRDFLTSFHAVCKSILSVNIFKCLFDNVNIFKCLFDMQLR